VQNLITNAIKFTRLEETRHISVTLSISFIQPVQNADGRVSFMGKSETEEAKTLQADWEKGQIVGVPRLSLSFVLLTGSGLHYLLGAGHWART
jgi:hypothetical protein